ncbi:MAG: hypothetical protein ABMA13_16180 [Chthoniobacteraceae bacterium]
MTDFIPHSYKNLRDWLQKQVTDLTAALAATLNMSAAERQVILDACNALLPLLNDIVEKLDQLEQLTADLQALLLVHTPPIRAGIKRAKTSPGCTPGIIVDMEWKGESHEFDPDTARPTIDVEAQRGRVKIDGKKPGFDSANIYYRRKGDVQWKLIESKRKRFPYYDEQPLAVAGQPEVREYMAIGVIGDEEVGQMSEIKEVVYAG